MNSLENYNIIKQRDLSTYRPCYPIPQNMSTQDTNRVKNARDDLQKAYKKEIAKPASQRNQTLLYEMDVALNPRLCGW
jgi:hypothetical protein